MLIQDKHLGSTIGMFSGLVALFLLSWLEEVAISQKYIHQASPSFLCDTGCLPTFIVSIFFGSLAYQLRKRRICNPNYGIWKKRLSKIGEGIFILLFLLFGMAISEEPSWYVLSISSSLWVITAYITLLFSKPSPTPLKINIWVIFIMVIACLMIILLSLRHIDTVNKKGFENWNKRISPNKPTVIQ